MGEAMSPRVLHRRQGRLLCLIIIGAALVFSWVVLNDSTHITPQPQLWALRQRVRSKLSGKVAVHVNEELDVDTFGEARMSRLQVHHAGPEDGDEAGKPVIGGVRKTFGRHGWRLDGLLEVNPYGRHPIYDLVEKAKKKWNAKVARQSKTLRDAVREYKRRYQRDPPLGFNRWWDYVQRHGVQLPDEYDQIHHDIEPFWGIRPADLRKLQAEHEAEMGTYTLGNGQGFGPIEVVNTTLAPDAVDVADKRSNDQLGILDPVKQWIPPFRATFTCHDAPILFVGHDLRSEAIDAAAVREYINISKHWDDRHLGWGSACPVNSPLRVDINFSVPPSIPALHAQRPKTFIHSHLAAMDPCLHPTHTHLMGQLTNYGKGPPPRQRLHPSFTMSSTRMHSDILVVAPEMWTEDLGNDPAWEDKRLETLLWRGTTTGTRMEEDMSYWRLSQRLRLVEMTNQQTGTFDVLTSTDYDRPVGEPLTVEVTALNEDLVDIGFSGEPGQCSPGVCAIIASEYKFLEAQSWDEANDYKYLLDIDGNGWSARFKRLMTSNSLVLKATICPEWFSDRVMPWVHYVPVKTDLTDLYDIMTFFRGDPSGNSGHDGMAKEIARAGKVWSKTFWRREDMTAYMFRLFLEWARVLSPDRDEMNFELPNEPESDY